MLVERLLCKLCLYIACACWPHKFPLVKTLKIPTAALEPTDFDPLVCIRLYNQQSKSSSRSPGCNLHAAQTPAEHFWIALCYWSEAWRWRLSALVGSKRSGLSSASDLCEHAQCLKYYVALLDHRTNTRHPLYPGEQKILVIY